MRKGFGPGKLRIEATPIVLGKPFGKRVRSTDQVSGGPVVWASGRTCYRENQEWLLERRLMEALEYLRR